MLATTSKQEVVNKTMFFRMYKIDTSIEDLTKKR
jgi:hypothetical protein